MAEQGVRESIRRIAMLGNHLPRQCGIATFTGAADTSIALATASIKELLRWLDAQ